EVAAVDVVVRRAHVEHAGVERYLAVDMARRGARAPPHRRGPGDLAIEGEVGERLGEADARGRLLERLAHAPLQRRMERADGVAEERDDLAKERVRGMERRQLTPHRREPRI